MTQDEPGGGAPDAPTSTTLSHTGVRLRAERDPRGEGASTGRVEASDGAAARDGLCTAGRAQGPPGARRLGAAELRLVRIMKRLLPILGLLGVFAAAAPADAAFSGENGKIAYARGELQHSIWSVNPDGTGNAQLTQDSTDGSSYLPAWSRKGERIAFAGTRRRAPVPAWEVEVMNPDGSGRAILTRLAQAGLELLDKPSWSPDGGKSAIAAHPRNPEFGLCVRDYIWDFFDRQACSVGVYTVNADGTGLTRLVDGFQPAWSPRGDRIVFSAYRGATTELYTMRSDGLGVSPLTLDEFRNEEPSWSPDGSQLAFTSDRVQRLTHPSWDRRCCSAGPGDIFVMDADGANVRALTTAEGLDAAPAWSPEGDEIAFASTRRTPNCDPTRA